MAIVVNRTNGNLTSGSSEALDLTGDDNAIIFGGLALDTGGIATFTTATIGSDQFVTDSSHDVETVLGTRTFITASGVIAPPTVSGSQTFTQNTSGNFDGTGFHMFDCSGVDPVNPLKETPPPITYNLAIPADHTYDIDAGGLVIMLVTTNSGSVPTSIPGWTQAGTTKSISIMTEVATFYRIAAADETDATINCMQGAEGRGFSRLWVYNPASVAPPDVTAPILTSPFVTSRNTTGFTPQVITDEANGTVYSVVVPNGDTPSATQIIAGQQSSGAAAINAQSLVISATGVISLSPVRGLEVGTEYEVFFVHEDASSNQSNVVSVGTRTNSYGLLDLIENYTVTTGIQTSPHAASNTSGNSYDESNNRVGMVRNNAAQIHEYDADDLTTIIRTITLTFAFGDTEGFTYMGDGEIAVASENGGAYYVYICDLPEGTTDISVGAKQQLTLAAAGTDNNSGLEGIVYDRVKQVFWGVGEGEQDNTFRKVFRFARPVNQTTDYIWTDAELTVEEDPFDPEVFFAPYAATGEFFDLAGLGIDPLTGHLLFVSDTGNRVLQVNVDDTANPVVVSELAIALFQSEAVEVLGNGFLLVTGETNEYQVFHPVINTSVITENTAAVNAIADNLYTGFEDRSLSEENPTQTDPDSSNLTILNSSPAGTDRNQLIRVTGLSNIPATAVVVSAKLYIKSVFTDAGTVDVDLRQCLQPWVAGQSSWNNFSTGNAWDSPGAGTNGVDRVAVPESTTSIDSTANTWFELDCTTLVDNIINGTVVTDNGFLLSTDNEAGTIRTYHSSEATDTNRPELVVEYVIPGGVVSPIAVTIESLLTSLLSSITGTVGAINDAIVNNSLPNKQADITADQNINSSTGSLDVSSLESDLDADQNINSGATGIDFLPVSSSINADQDINNAVCSLSFSQFGAALVGSQDINSSDTSMNLASLIASASGDQTVSGSAISTILSSITSALDLDHDKISSDISSDLTDFQVSLILNQNINSGSISSLLPSGTASLTADSTPNGAVSVITFSSIEADSTGDLNSNGASISFVLDNFLTNLVLDYDVTAADVNATVTSVLEGLLADAQASRSTYTSSDINGSFAAFSANLAADGSIIGSDINASFVGLQGNLVSSDFVNGSDISSLMSGLIVSIVGDQDVASADVNADVNMIFDIINVSVTADHFVNNSSVDSPLNNFGTELNLDSIINSASLLTEIPQNASVVTLVNGAINTITLDGSGLPDSSGEIVSSQSINSADVEALNPIITTNLTASGALNTSSIEVEFPVVFWDQILLADQVDWSLSFSLIPKVRETLINIQSRSRVIDLNINSRT